VKIEDEAERVFQQFLDESVRELVEEYSKDMHRDLILECIVSDINKQMERLILEYKATGDETYKTNAAYLRSEFHDWWDSESCEFVKPKTY
jgi:hypothetical protein